MPSVKTILKRAQELERAGRRMEAMFAFNEVLERQPANADALHGVGRIFIEDGSPDRAVSLLEKASESRPADPVIRYHLGSAYQSLHRVDEALASYRRAREIRPGLIDPYIAESRLLNLAHRYDESHEVSKRAVSVSPNHGFANAMMAQHERRAGELDLARARLDRVLARKPNLFDETPLRFELGHVLDALGESESSFLEFESAQALCMRSPQYRATNWQLPWRVIERSRDVYTRERLEEWVAAEWDDGLRDPVFLVGFPRSGTTLTEQMLDAHEGITSLDERPTLARAIAAITEIVGPASTFPDNVPLLDDAGVRRVRGVYRDAVLETGDPGSSLIVDKMPLHIMNVGMMVRCFPKSKILVALRDPRGVCLSCHMQWWNMNMFMANLFTIDRIASFYSAVMGAWLDIRDLIRLPVHHFRYEDMVSDPEREARSMIDFLGLAWDDSVLRFHERSGRRFVSTPSAEAVSRPITSAAATRWRRYEASLAPVSHHLERALSEFGYSISDADLAD